ncbi:MAG: hypothetical protein KGL39_46225 [Patescibacteria group bacterium]|nr:hypothetical protein [Patescibacteria group bacterium]
MPLGNAWKHAPARQARLHADMQNPEYVRRQCIYREARGKLLGHFNKRDLVAEWNIEWNLSGRSDEHPDFPEWLEQNRDRLTRRRDADRESQKRINEAHAAWIAVAGMPREV